MVSRTPCDVIESAGKVAMVVRTTPLLKPAARLMPHLLNWAKAN
jgi:hypothetical protein